MDDVDKELRMDDVTRELKIRNRITAIFNKPQEDFGTKDEWDNYLETIEDLVYNLTYGVDVQQTEARISDYERANRANIIANQARKAEANRRQWEAANPAATADTAAAAAAASDAPQAYMPSSMGPGALPRAPVPAPQQTAPRRRYAVGSAEELSQSAAAGWSKEIQHMRGIHEALASLLIHV